MCEFVACFTMLWTRVSPLIGKVFYDNFMQATQNFAFGLLPLSSKSLVFFHLEYAKTAENSTKNSTQKTLRLGLVTNKLFVNFNLPFCLPFFHPKEK
jgi:hypothetical protein